MKKTCIIIAGPTAVGKTALSISLAGKFNTSIISADSRQCFKELNIGVAKPGQKVLHEIRHYFINSHSVHDNINAGTFEEYALKACDEIFKTKDIAVMVGGTGLYIKAFCEGMDNMPEVSSSVRQEIVEQYEAKGLSWLQKEVERADPLFYEKGEIKNPQRMMRALEIVKTTGRSIFDFRSQNKKERSFNILKIGVTTEKGLLHNSINERVDEMIAQGLLKEVESLYPLKHLNPLRTVGYQELIEFIDGKLELNTAIEKIKRNTRQYAKRQLTWFKKDNAIPWFEADQWERIEDHIVQKLKR